ncbi:MAG TPA: SMP-30/gluconolactonase/LRE family protein [Microvirga sp.]|nr:SMP-30/gluconolactonase/LRE family protein [Microvirga sp.]
MAETVTRFGDTVDELAEGPVWDSREQVLSWFDVVNRILHRRWLGTGQAADVRLERMPGSLALRERGGLVLASRNSIGLSDDPAGPFRAIENHSIDFAVERINDGAADRQGRFWFGTFSPTMSPGGGALYRLDPDLSVRRMDSGLTMSNGIAWSPDDTTMYFADSSPGRIYRYAFAADTGEIGPREVFLDYEGRSGRPDGCTVDSEGFLWVAEVEGGRVARYDPSARLDRVIELPVSRPTSVAFVGPDLRTLFITSMRVGLSEEERSREALAGAVFVTRPGVAGLPEPRFLG